MATRTCLECGKEKDVSKFVSNVQCANCCHIKRINSSSEKFFKRMIGNAQINAGKRLEQGRESAGTFDLTWQDIQDIYHKQEGKCYYSNIPFVLEINSDWKCSLERTDQQQGYTLDNVVLVCVEFNSNSQWSTDKFRDFIRLIYTNHEKQHVDFSVPKRNRTCGKMDRRYDAEGKLTHAKCTRCGLVKHIDEFTKILGAGCKTCRSDIARKRKETPRGHLSKFLQSMSTRHTVTPDRNFAKCDVTLCDLIEIYHKQGGLCAYCGIPLKFGRYAEQHWTASIERIDNNKGYLKDNICLIVFELNTPTQWSRAKIEYLKTLHPAPIN